jgi:predicted amino acid dehydrogenase
MKRFAFIVNPTTIKQFKIFWPIMRIVPDFIIKYFQNNLPALKVSRIKRIRSAQGKTIEGYLIVCPLLNKDNASSSEDFIFDRIIQAGSFAKGLGAKIVGLNGYASYVAREKSFNLAKSLKAPVTNGKAFIAWSVFEGIYRLCRAKGINLKNSTLAIIGTAGSLDSLCARKLSGYMAKIIVCAKDEEKLLKLQETALQVNPIEIIVEKDAASAAKIADIVITTVDNWQEFFNMEELKPNAMIFDASSPWNVSGRINGRPRPDITIIKSGLIKVPFAVNLGINTGLPKDIVCASLAETMLLTFEEKFTSYSSGENINLDSLEEIADLAVKHGFEVWVPEAPLI